MIRRMKKHMEYLNEQKVKVENTKNWFPFILAIYTSYFKLYGLSSFLKMMATFKLFLILNVTN
jgi:hypothetical protein